MVKKAILVAVVVLVGIPLVALAYTFTTIDVPGAILTAPGGINARGDIVGFYNDSTNTAHGFRLSQGTFTTVDFPGFLQTAARSTNNRDDIVGQVDNGPITGPISTSGFLLKHGEFTKIDFPGANFTGVFGINDPEQMVGNYIVAGINHGFMLDDGVFTSIDVPGALQTFGFGINDRGDIAGSYIDVTGQHGYLLHDGTFDTINVPGATSTQARGISSRGDIVGQYTSAGLTHAFVLRKGTFTTIDVPGRPAVLYIEGTPQHGQPLSSALTAQQQQGLAIFSSDRGRCASCHKGAEFTGASTRMVLGTGLDTFGGDGPIESMMMGDRQLAIYDNGFYNIGVVPAANDVGIGGNDPFGNPLSFTRQLKGMLKGVPAPDALSHSLDPCTFQALEGCTVVNDPNMRDAVTGSFKTPTLRNIELTGPYFHNGGAATLEQVIDFYSRGGNVRKTAGGDTSGFGATTSNVDLDVMPILLTPSEKAALVAFLKALTDDRVRYEAAPFDHPSLRVPQGATGDNVTLTTTTGVAVDQFISIPAVGQTGLSVPIKPFTPAR